MADSGSGIHQSPPITQAGSGWACPTQVHRDAMRSAPLELCNEAAVLTPLQPSLKTSPTQLLDQHGSHTVAMNLAPGGYCSSLM